MILADALNDNRVTYLRTVIKLYNDRASEAAAGQLDLFTGERKSKEQIIKEVIELLKNASKEETKRELKSADDRRMAAAERERASVAEQAGASVGSGEGSAGAERSGGSEKEAPSLTHDEAISLIAEMEERAELAPEIELTIENWDALFGAEGRVVTPIGEVKMGENQFTKLMRQGREGKLGMIKPTLENPDVIIEDASEAKEDDVAERNSSYVFVKAFKKADGSRYYYFTSITVSKDGREVVVSNQEKSRNRLLRLMTEGKMLWRTPKDATTASVEQQGLDYAQPSETETATKGSGITPQSTDMSPSAGKGSENSETGKEKTEKVAVEEKVEPAEPSAARSSRSSRGSQSSRTEDAGGEVPSGEVREQRGAAAERSDEFDRAVLNEFVELMRGNGIDVVTDVAEIERVYRAWERVQAIASEMRKRKSAPETASVPDREHHHAVISVAEDGAKVIQNLESGINALQKIADGAEQVPNAMTREDLSQYGGDNQITFYFGKVGDANKNFKGGYGISHIGGKHGVETLLHVLDVIARGKVDRYVEGNKTIVLSDGEYEVLLGLTRFGDKETWLFNGWKKEEKTGADGEVSTRSDATQANPTFSRDDLGAVLSDAKVQQILDISRSPIEKLREMRVWHGSGAEFDAFDHSHMGEGEGAQAYGWGTYVTQSEGVARGYAGNRVQYRGQEISYETLSRYEKDLQALRKALSKRENYDDYIAQIDSIIDGLRERIGSADYNFEGAEEAINRDIELAESRKNREAHKRVVENLKSTIAETERDIERLKASLPQRNLYEVEIPKNDGGNYLRYDKQMGAQGDALERIDNELTARGWHRSEQNDVQVQNQIVRLEKDGKDIILRPVQQGRDLYYELENGLGSAKAASEFLSECGFVGIEYPTNFRSGGNERGEKNYVIFKESDAKIVDHIRFFRTERGEVLGFTMGGRIYVDPRVASSETPVHEYFHLWAEALEKANPRAWAELKQALFADEGLKPLIDEVKAAYPELAENELAHEVFAHYGGRRGRERLSEMRERMLSDAGHDVLRKAGIIAMFERMRELLNRYWSLARDLFAGKNVSLRDKSVDEIADMTLGDLLGGFNPVVGVAAPFYSNAERAVEGVKQDKAKAEQWKAMLTKGGGIKAGEDKWMGLSQWLDEHKGETLTKGEVLEFVRANGIRMEEVNYGDAIFSNNSIRNLEGDIKRGIANGESIEDVLSAWDNAFGDTKLEEYRAGRFEISEDGTLTSNEETRFPINSTRLDYTTEGLENKREIAFVLPDVEPYQENDEVHFGPENGGKAVMWVRFGETKDKDGKLNTFASSLNEP